MKNRRSKRKKRHVIMRMKPNQTLTVYDMFSRFDFEITLIQKDSGRTELDFNIPGSMRIARGAMANRGTIAKLADSKICDINVRASNHQSSQQPTNETDLQKAV